jgi:hypothetical protein
MDMVQQSKWNRFWLILVEEHPAQGETKIPLIPHADLKGSVVKTEDHRSHHCKQDTQTQ